MKPIKKFASHPIKLSSMRQASLVAVVLWSAHYHGGQWSREYRLGCLARMLVERSNEIGRFMLSQWFDALEPFVTGAADMPRVYTPEFSKKVKEKYDHLAAITEKEMEKRGRRTI